MTDTALLQEKIKKSGLKKSFIAERIGLSRQQFSKKVKNEAPFNQYEMEDLCDVLNIKPGREKEAIFFAKNVS